MDKLISSVIKVGSHVEVVDTDITARVTAILLEESGIQFRINYWHDNHRRTEWVNLEEIKILKPV
jgi:hypothetical protein